MIYINEWLPNPIGRDDSVTGGEFIELYNSGRAVSLTGYALGTGAKKHTSLSGYSIAGGGYLVFYKPQSKLSLKNTGGAVLLYGPGGQIIDQAAFEGVAPEGRSFSRIDYGTAPIGHFAFVYPTPGAVNGTIDNTVSVKNYPVGISLTQNIPLFTVFLLGFGVCVFFLLFFTYVIHKNRNISDFFFGGDARGGA